MRQTKIQREIDKLDAEIAVLSEVRTRLLKADAKDKPKRKPSPKADQTAEVQR